MHMDGENGSTNFIDSSVNNLPVTTVGNVSINSSIFKYGNGSANFNGVNSNYLSLPSSSLFQWTGDFTIEGWFYFNSLSSNNPLISTHNGADRTGWIIFQRNSTELGIFGANSFGSIIMANFIIVNTSILNTWIHLAVSRSSNTLRLFLNGVLKITSNSPGSIVSGTTLTVGHYPYFNDGAKTFNGYIDEIRITKDVARYIDNFTPPTEAYPNP